MSIERKIPLAELLRPQTLDELILPEATVRRLKEMLEAQAPANMLLWGPSGTGKTSTAHIFMKARGQLGTLKVDGSVQSGVDEVRNIIDRFASTIPFSPGLKLVFIDEADFLSQTAQASLRGVIERSSETCRFIFAVNDLSKVNDAIRSRLLCIPYGISAAAPHQMDRYKSRLAERLAALGIEVDQKRLGHIVSVYFPDLRRINIHLEFEFRTANPPDTGVQRDHTAASGDAG